MNSLWIKERELLKKISKLTARKTMQIVYFDYCDQSVDQSCEKSS